jgi:transcriptional regulator with XRE-family HTH domain
VKRTDQTSAFAAWLRRRIDAWGVSDRHAAEKIGIGYSMLWNYLHGKQEPTRRSVLKLAAAFNVEASDVESLLPDRYPTNSKATQGVVRETQTDDAPSQEVLGDLKRSATGESAIDPFVRVARFRNDRVRLAFYDFLADPNDMTEEEAESLADALEAIERQRKDRRHAPDNPPR